MIRKQSVETKFLKGTWLVVKHVPLAFTSWVVFCCLWFEQTSNIFGRITIILCWVIVLALMFFPYGSRAPGRLIKLINRSLFANFLLVGVIFGGVLIAPRIFKPYYSFAVGGINEYRKAVKHEEALKYAQMKCKIHIQKSSDDFEKCWDESYKSLSSEITN